MNQSIQWINTWIKDNLNSKHQMKFGLSSKFLFLVGLKTYKNNILILGDIYNNKLWICIQMSACGFMNKINGLVY